MAAYIITTRAGKGQELLHTEGDANFTAVSDIITALGLTDADSTITFSAKVLAPNMFITESATAGSSVAAQGQYWVLDGATNRPVFDDDAGVSTYLIGLDASSDGHVVLPLTNDAVTPTFAFGDGGDGIYSSADGSLNFSMNGVSEWQMNAGALSYEFVTDGPALMGESSSLTNPTLVPRGNDSDTGIGGTGANILSLITGGVEAVNIDANQDITTMQLKKYGETQATNATATGAVTINVNNGPLHVLTLTGNVTFTFSNPLASGYATTLSLVIIQDGTGSRTIAWPASVKFEGGTDPGLTIAAGTESWLSFVTYDGGTSWTGFLAADNVS